jgi:hypothetical protein
MPRRKRVMFAVATSTILLLVANLIPFEYRPLWSAPMSYWLVPLSEWWRTGFLSQATYGWPQPMFTWHEGQFGLFHFRHFLANFATWFSVVGAACLLTRWFVNRKPSEHRNSPAVKTRPQFSLMSIIICVLLGALLLGLNAVPVHSVAIDVHQTAPYVVSTQEVYGWPMAFRIVNEQHDDSQMLFGGLLLDAFVFCFLIATVTLWSQRLTVRRQASSVEKKRESLAA